MTIRDPRPLFTIIIPTKDRAPYLYHTLRTCSMQEYENLEIVVSDDASSDDTRSVVEAAARKDPRIRYTSPKGGGMLDNFEHALDQVKPGYVIALGGDDGIMPHGVRDMSEMLGSSGHDALCWPTPVYFYDKARGEASQLVLPMIRRRLRTGSRIVESRTFLERQAKNLSYVWDFESPMFYVKGVISTKLVDQVRRRTPGGRFYACSTPDGYSGIVVAGEMASWTFSELPFSLHGISPSSAGFGYLAGGEEARKQSEAFFSRAVQFPMHRDLALQPYSPLITLMTADYLLTTADLPGWQGVKPRIDYRDLLVKALSELQDGLFARDRVARELRILDGIAAHHGLSEFFRSKVRRTRRNKRAVLAGNAVSSSRLYFDAASVGVENIVDAAYFAYYAHRTSAALSASSALKALANSVRYRVAAMRRGGTLPEEREWIDGRGVT